MAEKVHTRYVGKQIQIFEFCKPFTRYHSGRISIRISWMLNHVYVIFMVADVPRALMAGCVAV